VYPRGHGGQGKSAARACWVSKQRIASLPDKMRPNEGSNGMRNALHRALEPPHCPESTISRKTPSKDAGFPLVVWAIHRRDSDAVQEEGQGMGLHCHRPNVRSIWRTPWGGRGNEGISTPAGRQSGRPEIRSSIESNVCQKRSAGESFHSSTFRWTGSGSDPKKHALRRSPIGQRKLRNTACGPSSRTLIDRTKDGKPLPQIREPGKAWWDLRFVLGREVCVGAATQQGIAILGRGT